MKKDTECNHCDGIGCKSCDSIFIINAELLEACKQLINTVYKCDHFEGDVVCGVKAIENMEQIVKNIEKGV